MKILIGSYNPFFFT